MAGADSGATIDPQGVERVVAFGDKPSTAVPATTARDLEIAKSQFVLQDGYEIEFSPRRSTFRWPTRCRSRSTHREDCGWPPCRSEEHTSEHQSLMRISYAV